MRVYSPVLKAVFPDLTHLFNRLSFKTKIPFFISLFIRFPCALEEKIYVFFLLRCEKIKAAQQQAFKDHQVDFTCGVKNKNVSRSGKAEGRTGQRGAEEMGKHLPASWFPWDEHARNAHTQTHTHTHTHTHTLPPASRQYIWVFG